MKTQKLPTLALPFCLLLASCDPGMPPEALVNADSTAQDDETTPSDNGEGEGEGEGEGVVRCLKPTTVHLNWVGAELFEPMKSAESKSEGDMVYVYTEETNQGRATKVFLLPCGDDWYVWAKGRGPSSDALPLDNFHIEFDDSSSFSWAVTPSDGCDPWSWKALGGQGKRAIPLERGVHTVTVDAGYSNGEGPNDPAGLGTVILSNDPNFSPDK